jgi:hypothetical protein
MPIHEALGGEDDLPVRKTRLQQIANFDMPHLPDMP